MKKCNVYQDTYLRFKIKRTFMILWFMIQVLKRDNKKKKNLEIS